eukprot:UN08327
MKKSIEYQSLKLQQTHTAAMLAQLSPEIRTISQYTAPNHLNSTRRWHMGLFDQLYAFNYPTEWLHTNKRTFCNGYGECS